ncbi:MAG: DNRLRE domain-containing protein [Actinomycetota bacterium]|nr:DNRLRE domain-containing protein [Actinomycetota bacterium]
MRAVRLLVVNLALGSVSLAFVLVSTGDAAAAPASSTTHLAIAAPVISAKLVQKIATSAWNPASPDPSGIVYLPGPDRLEVSDSEVDETTGAGYHGVNLWQITRSGTVTGTGTTLAYSKEPTGLGYSAGTNTLFISDDIKKRIWVVKPGSDGRFGTSDDVVTSINAGAYGSNDTEDPEYDPATGHLFFLDGAGTEVYDIDPVNGVFGDGNDVMKHFDVGKFGPSDWEGLGSDPANGTLLVGARKTKQIFEITKSGSLVRIIDASGISGLRLISGLAMAPASNGSGQMNYWIVDRAIDNGPNPNENDGKIFEISISSQTVGIASAPSITDFVPLSGPVGTSVTIDGSGFTGTTDVQFNGTSVGSGNFTVVSDAQITSRVPSGATTGPIPVTTPGGTATSSTDFTVTPVTTLSFGPDADTFVRSDDPSHSFGSKASFSVDGSPTKHGLLRFTVSGVGSGTIHSATLRLYCLDASDKGGDFYRVANNSWQENTVTWNTEPVADPTSIASLGAVSVNTWYEVDLSSLITGDGTYSIRIASTSSNGADYSTKEGAPGSAPQLVVTLGP